MSGVSCSAPSYPQRRVHQPEILLDRRFRIGIVARMPVEEETLHFRCAHCALELTVPHAMAGVSGPCPGCGQQIRSPQPAPRRKTRPEEKASSSPGALLRRDVRGVGEGRAEGELPPRRAEPRPGANQKVPDTLPPERTGRTRRTTRAIDPSTGLSARYTEKREVRDLLRIAVAVLATIAVVAVVVALVRHP